MDAKKREIAVREIQNLIEQNLLSRALFKNLIGMILSCYNADNKDDMAIITDLTSLVKCIDINSVINKS